MLQSRQRYLFEIFRPCRGKGVYQLARLVNPRRSRFTAGSRPLAVSERPFDSIKIRMCCRMGSAALALAAVSETPAAMPSRGGRSIYPLPRTGNREEERTSMSDLGPLDPDEDDKRAAYFNRPHNTGPIAYSDRNIREVILQVVVIACL